MDWSVPFFSVAREFAANRDEIMHRVEAVFESGQVLQGPEVAGLEADIASMCRRKHGVAVASCTDALFFALKVAGVGPGDEVLVPDFSFVASASCIVRAGAVPVFVDIGESGNMDLEVASSLVTSNTRAMIYVHLYGLMGDAAKVESFADSHSIALIEDAAQAPGAQRNGRTAGSMGLVSCLSFDPTKPISAPGSGGMALTDDDEIATRLSRLRYHGKDAAGQFTELGYNSQMPASSATVMRFKVGRNEAWVDCRREIAARYNRELSATDVLLPHEPGDARHIFHKYVIRHPSRNDIREALNQAGVQCMVHYEAPLHKQPLFAHCIRDTFSPVAEAFACEALSLPCHPYLTTEEVDRVIEVIVDGWRS